MSEIIRAGWICLHRKFIDWEWYQDNNSKILFIHLLLTANFEDKNWKGHIIKRGQLVTSYAHLALETKLSVQQVRTALWKLASTKEITIESTSQNTLITIVKYSVYQDKEEKNNKQSNTQPNNQITTTKQYNNINIYSPSEDARDSLIEDFEKIWKIYPRKDGKSKAFNSYKSWLKGKKVLNKTVKLTNKQIWFATKKYADESKEKEKTFIKMGSTFFADAILDYVEDLNE